MVVLDMIYSVYDQRNFPGHHVFQKLKKNMYRARWMNAHGLTWVRVDVFLRREAKTRQKEEQMVLQDVFCAVYQRPKRVES